MSRRRFVLLDRDGTIIVERNYLSDPGQVELLPNAVAGMKKMKEMGLGLAMVSNQSAVGRGQFKMSDVEAVNAKLCSLLADGGVTLDGIFICPHSPGEGCDCRKPEPGLALKAGRDLGFQPGSSFVVGDKACDLELARNIQAVSILVRTGYGAEVEVDSMTYPDLVADDLMGAAEMIGAMLSSRVGASDPDPLLPDSGERFRRHLLCSIAAKQRLLTACQGAVLTAAAVIATSLKARKKVMLCGNGGSAADSQHIAGELVSVLSQKFLRPGLAAIALTTDTSILTASANDFGFGGIFERQVQALGQEGDVLVGISTSGNSENVLRAVRLAKASGIKTVGLLGGGGGQLADIVDVAVVIPSSNVQNIQEAHITVGHILCDLVERALFIKAEV